MNELERALLDIAEVRDRLAQTQRFKGYSGVAAAASGVFALVAGAVQAVLVPVPQGAHDARLYFAIWLTCCAAAAIVNYGAIAHWFVSDASARDRWQTRTVGLAILPALVLGAALSFALLAHDHVSDLPGIWYGCYGVGLFASRTLIPRGVAAIAAGFLAAGIALMFAPPAIALAWWVLPLGFGLGQIAIGALVLRDRAEVDA
ncbi:MAG: hypothetical protein KGN02_03730 [bacterium]|nr:hypothetical protein [bacterium]